MPASSVKAQRFRQFASDATPTQIGFSDGSFDGLGFQPKPFGLCRPLFSIGALLGFALGNGCGVRRVKPLLIAMRTASRRNPSVYLVAIPYLLHSKHCSKETGTKP
jgi:hypothetical protein